MGSGTTKEERMSVKHPNKETIRRVCSMFKCESCWLLNDDNKKALSLLVDLNDNDLVRFKEEQEAWSGFLFTISNQNSLIEEIEAIKNNGELLMPVDINVPLEDIKMRQKKVRE